jgi:enoyl-[acyl-carrier protein] reductase I
MDLRGRDFWALILGGSSGFGLASAFELARLGMNIFIVHRDRRAHRLALDETFSELRALGTEVYTSNSDALTNSGKRTITKALHDRLGANGKIRTLLHSIAFGSVRSLQTTSADQPSLTEEDLQLTLHAMAGSLLSWTQLVHEEGLFTEDARILSLTSEGNTVSWPGYGAVSAAKCALEALSRSIAVEFAPFGIRSNIIQPGVTDTPALRMIPGFESMMQKALHKNPFHRLTVPEDVAKVVGLLSLDNASWVNGSVIRVDGGEAISGGFL